MLLQITALQLALLCTVYAQFLDEDELTYQQLYDWGMESYNEERWFECTAYFKRAIEDHDSFHSKLLKCRHECEAEMRERYARAFQQQIYDSVHEKGSALSSETQLELYTHYWPLDYSIRLSGCTRACDKRSFGIRPTRERDAYYVQAFESRKPYNYLQFCYYKLDDFKHATQCSYTFYIANPQDEQTLKNLQFYSSLRTFDRQKDLVDLEEKNYQKYHREAINAYDGGDYKLAIDKFRLTLDEFYAELESCRTMCTVNAEVLTNGLATKSAGRTRESRADIHASLLICRHSCLFKLSRVNERLVYDYLPTIYNYLQYAYHSVDLSVQACREAANYLLFMPKDEAMMRNKAFYDTLFADVEDAPNCEPSRQAAAYARTFNIEAELLLNYNHFTETDEDGLYPHGNDEGSGPTAFESIEYKPLSMFVPDDYRQNISVASVEEDVAPSKPQKTFFSFITDL